MNDDYPQNDYPEPPPFQGHPDRVHLHYGMACNGTAPCPGKPVALEGWLRATQAVEVISSGGTSGYHVWVTNGQEGSHREGRIVAWSDDHEDAELVAESLRRMRRGASAV